MSSDIPQNRRFLILLFRDSTRREIEYAKEKGKSITYLQKE